MSRLTSWRYIPLGKDRSHSSVVEARYNTYRDAKEWEHANAMSRLMCKRRPSTLKWRLNYADGYHQMGDTEKAIACLKDAKNKFGEDAQYLFRLAKYHALLGKVEEAKDLVRRVFKLNGSSPDPSASLGPLYTYINTTGYV